MGGRDHCQARCGRACGRTLRFRANRATRQPLRPSLPSQPTWAAFHSRRSSDFPSTATGRCTTRCTTRRLSPRASAAGSPAVRPAAPVSAPRPSQPPPVALPPPPSAGKQRLDECLAKLGFSLDECRQKYAMASLALKQRLGEKLEAHAEEFNLVGLVYGSFSRTLGSWAAPSRVHVTGLTPTAAAPGFGQSLSAADVAHAVTALLESGTCEGTAGQRSSSGADAAAAAASPVAAAAAAAQRAALSGTGGGQGDEAAAAAAAAAARCPSFEMHFNLAYDALGRGGRKVLQRGIQSSMRLQRTTVETVRGRERRRGPLRCSHPTARRACIFWRGS